MENTLEEDDKRNKLLTDFSSIEKIIINSITQTSKSAVYHGKKRKILPFDRLHLKMLSWMVINDHPFPLLIISSNVEVLKPTEDLVERNYQVFLAYEKNLASKGMKTARGHLTWTCTSVYKGERANKSST